MKAVLCLLLVMALFAVPGHAPTASGERVVYVIDNFNDGLYHSRGCCSLYGQKVKSMTEYEAQREHRQPCQHCRPDQP